MGNRGFILDILQARSTTLCLYGLAPWDQNPPIPLGNCNLYLPLPLAIVLVSGSNSAGFATTRLEVPLELSLLGAPLWAQGFVFDPTAPPIGVAFTQAQQMRLGD